MTAKNYIVQSQVDYNNKLYAIGDTISLPDEIALDLGDAVVAAKAEQTPVPPTDEAPASPAGAAPVTQDEIIAAIAQLNPNQEGHFTKSGVPQVAAIESILGRDISSEQRDAAWNSQQG